MLFDFGHAGETVISVFQLWKALSAFVLIITFWRLLFCRNFEVWDKFWDKSFPIPPLHFLTEESRGSKRKVLIEKRLTSVRAKEIYKGEGFKREKCKKIRHCNAWKDNALCFQAGWLNFVQIRGMQKNYQGMLWKNRTNSFAFEIEKSDFLNVSKAKITCCVFNLGYSQEIVKMSILDEGFPDL